MRDVRMLIAALIVPGLVLVACVTVVAVTWSLLGS
jgi:hypothetical protein